MTILKLFLGFTMATITLFEAGSAVTDELQAHSPEVSGIDDANALRVMTFNIRYHNPQDGENAWPNRKEMVASMICLHRADVAGLQEVKGNQLAELRTLLPERRWMGLQGRKDSRDADERVPIVYRPDRLELLDEGIFWLSETPDIPASKGWDAALPRITTWGKFRDRRTGHELFVFNTHFDHVGKKAQVESAKLLYAKAASIVGDKPTLVTGDMNCVDTMEPYAIFTGKQTPPADEAERNAPKATPDRGAFSLQDTLHASRRPHHGPTSTFNGFGPLPPNRRIDYVFATPTVQVLQHATLADKWDNDRWPSDHLPVLAEVVIGK